MTNHTNQFARHAALALAFAAFLGLSQAQAQSQTFDPSNGQTDTTPTGQSTGADETPLPDHPNVPWVHYPTVEDPGHNFGTTAENPSTGATESTSPESSCAYDYNRDGYVDFEDYLILLNSWSSQATSATQASFSDLLSLMSAWGSC